MKIKELREWIALTDTAHDQCDVEVWLPGSTIIDCKPRTNDADGQHDNDRGQRQARLRIGHRMKRTWVHSFFEALKRAVAPGDPLASGPAAIPDRIRLRRRDSWREIIQSSVSPPATFTAGPWHNEPPS